MATYNSKRLWLPLYPDKWPGIHCFLNCTCNPLLKLPCFELEKPRTLCKDCTVCGPFIYTSLVLHTAIVNELSFCCWKTARQVRHLSVTERIWHILLIPQNWEILGTCADNVYQTTYLPKGCGLSMRDSWRSNDFESSLTRKLVLRESNWSGFKARI